MEQDQVLLIDKDIDWSSFDVVKKLKFAGKFKKIGHAGTLDPMATGLLILCTGKLTKQIDTYQGQEKEYTGSIVLGGTTASYDLESEVENPMPFEHITENDILQAANQLTGSINQFPPIFSAKKINGVRAYDLARKGEEVKLSAKQVDVYEFSFTRISLPELEFKIRCSKGTYIRSLAHDIGQILGCGGYLKSLRRTKIGEFSVDNALTIPQWIEQFGPKI